MSDLHRISPFKCRLWDMHDRSTEITEDAGYRALVESIRVQGQKHPVLGRYVRHSDGCDIEIIYGARRLAAAKELGIDLIVDVRCMDDRQALIEMDIENRVRQDISPYERGRSYSRWLKLGLFATQAEMARALGVSEAQICRLLKYADLPAILVASFRSPREIREDWAATLSSLCKDSTRRAGVLRRASMLSKSSKKRSAHEIYEVLISDARADVVRSHPLDEVIKGRDGRRLFRIGVRVNTVHLIVPRNALSQELLTHITEQLKTTLDETDSSANGEPAGRPPPSSTDKGSLTNGRPHVGPESRDAPGFLVEPQLPMAASR